MIIFGTRGVKSTIDQGTFFCPQCGCEQPYQRRRVKRFAHVYFIPIFPIGSEQEYVECTACKSTWNDQVLDYSPGPDREQILSNIEQVFRRTVVLMMFADGELSDSETDMANNLYMRFFDTELTPQEIVEEISEAERDPKTIGEYLSEISGILNDEGKEMIVKSAMLMASADGRFDDEELKAVMGICDSLEMSRSHARGVLQDLMSGS